MLTAGTRPLSGVPRQPEWNPALRCIPAVRILRRSQTKIEVIRDAWSTSMTQWHARGASAPPNGNLDLLSMAVWFGLLTGMSQLVLRAILSIWLDRKVFFSLHVVWMAPLADATFFAAVGGLLWLLLLRVSPARRMQVGAAVFAFLVVLSAYLLYPRLHWSAAIILGIGVGI